MKIKRSVLLIVSFFCFHQVSNAQVIMSLIFGDKLNNEENLFGIHLDYSFNNLSNIEGSESLNTFNLGLFFTHRFDDTWELNLDLMAKYRRGASGIAAYTLEDPILTTQFAGTEVARRINYFSVPASIRYRFSKIIFAEIGPQISMRLGAEDLFEVELPDGELDLKVDIKDQVRTFDFGYVACIGMYMGKDQINAIGVRYLGGFSDVLKNEMGNQQHQQFSIYANIPIGRGKAGLK